MQPRLIRLRDVPTYLGTNIRWFNKVIRPHLHEYTMCNHGVVFDRLDLDAWIEEYKECNERPTTDRRKKVWDAKNRQVSLKEAPSGISTSRYSDDDYAKALAQATSPKPNAT